MARRSLGTRRRTIARVIANPRKGGSRRKAPRILSNPRRRSRTKSRSRARTKRKYSRKARRSNPRRSVKVRAHRRSKARRSKSRGRRRNPSYRLSSRSKSGWARMNPRHRRRKGSRSRKYGRRSNPRRRSIFGRAFRNPTSGITSGIAGMFRKIPFIGAPLALAAVNIPAGIVAGLSVEVPLRLSPFVAEQAWIPDLVKTNEWVYFTLLGAVSGGVIATGLTAAKIKLPMGFTAGQIAGLMTAAASGAGYAKMRTRQMANEVGLATPEQQIAGDDAISGMGALVANGSPMGALTMDSGMGMGPAYSVSPGGYGGPMHAVMVGG